MASKDLVCSALILGGLKRADKQRERVRFAPNKGTKAGSSGKNSLRNKATNVKNVFRWKRNCVAIARALGGRVGMEGATSSDEIQTLLGPYNDNEKGAEVSNEVHAAMCN